MRPRTLEQHQPGPHRQFAIVETPSANDKHKPEPFAGISSMAELTGMGMNALSAVVVGWKFPGGRGGVWTLNRSRRREEAD